MKNNLNEPNSYTDRKPAVAGSFYPAQPQALKNSLAETFSKAIHKKNNNEVIAIICPHAGYVYSAKVAASAFNQIDFSKKYDHIFIIGSSHRMSFNGASVYPGGNFITPLGAIPVDTLAQQLAYEPPLNGDTSPHIQEHSLEVQLPFLQFLIKKSFSIIPIVIGTNSLETCGKIAAVLKPYFNSNNLFIISTDFSHYPAYNEANRSDSIIIEAIMTNSSENFVKAKNQVENEDIPDLLTGICGWSSVLTLLKMTETLPGLKIKKIDYQNSGDASVGDKSRVVGYAALTVEKTSEQTNKEDFLSNKDKVVLLEIAREAIEAFVKKNKVPKPDEDKLSEPLRQKAGAFVTLTIKGELRGCIGTFRPSKSLFSVVQDLALSAGSNDSRFDPVSADELNSIEIEISVLTPLKKISQINEIEIGKHGIYIIKGSKTGTLLPQVAINQKWNREELLGHCARDKAGIGWDGWKDADIYIYEAIIFSEKENLP